MEGRRDDMEVELEPPGCCQKLFSGRDDRLLRLGTLLSSRTSSSVRSLPVLVRTLLSALD